MFEHDVFISYPHLSNREDKSESNGWIAQFHNDLQIRLDSAVGRETCIWRDSKMPIGTEFATAISNRLARSRVLLCVVSPAYVQSKWCRRELEEFRRHAAQNGGLTIGEQSRIIVVVQIPPPDNDLGLGEGLYSKFYDTPDAGVAMPFGQTAGTFKYDQYEKNLWRIAWAIKPIIEELTDGQTQTTRTVYLAETTSDRQADRVKLAEELRARDYVVLPENELPDKTFQEYSSAVKAELRRSFMSIHLLGETFGSVPERANGRSTIQIQVEAAGERCASDASFKRLLWIPDKLSEVEENQIAFLQDVRSKDADIRGTEMVERSFEDLKTRLLQILTRIQDNRKPDGRIRIYIMCDKRDASSVGPVGNFLYRKGYEVLPPPENQGAGQHHRSRLVQCDATLTIYGRSNYEWVRERYEEVQDKIKGWGREKPISCSAILRTDPKTQYKDFLFFHASKILEPPCYGGLADDVIEKPLNEFIEELEGRLHRD